MQGEHLDLAGQRVQVGNSQLLPVLARLLRGSAVSACVKILGNVYDFLISCHRLQEKLPTS
jgi:hypothetical protein